MPGSLLLQDVSAQAPAAPTPRRWQRRHTLWLAAILVLALGVRLYVVLGETHFQPLTDSADYDRIAVSLADHGSFPPSIVAPTGGPSAFRPPLFPLFLAAVYKVAGTASPHHRWQAGRAAEAVLGTATVGLTAAVALEIAGPALALLSAALAAVYPPLLLVGSSLMSESLFIPLLLLATLCGLRARRARGRRGLLLAAGCGVLAGLSALTRSVGAIDALPLAALALPGWPPARGWGRSALAAWRGAAPRAAVVLASAALTLVPWIVRNELVVHAFVPVSTEGGFALDGTYNAAARYDRAYPALWMPPVVQENPLLRAHPRWSEEQIAAALKRDGERYLEAHPGYVLEVAGLSLMRMFDLPGPRLEEYLAPYEGYDPGLTRDSVYAFWVIGLLALGGCFTRRARRAPLALWAIPAATLGVGILFSGGTRYRSPIDPYLVILAAAALLSLIAALRGQRRRGDAAAAPRRRPPARLPSAPA